MTARKKSLLEWVGIATAAISLIGGITAAAKWKSNVDTKVGKVDAISWDVQQVKLTINLTFPAQYDSALKTQIKLNGPRPEDEK